MVFGKLDNFPRFLTIMTINLVSPATVKFKYHNLRGTSRRLLDDESSNAVFVHPTQTNHNQQNTNAESSNAVSGNTFTQLYYLHRHYFQLSHDFLAFKYFDKF